MNTATQIGGALLLLSYIPLVLMPRYWWLRVLPGKPEQSAFLNYVRGISSIAFCFVMFVAFFYSMFISLITGAVRCHKTYQKRCLSTYYADSDPLEYWSTLLVEHFMTVAMLLLCIMIFGSMRRSVHREP